MEKILIVEDDPEVNRLLCRLLQKNGYKTVSTYNSLEASQILDRETVELILLDLMLPDLAG